MNAEVIHYVSLTDHKEPEPLTLRPRQYELAVNGRTSAAMVFCTALAVAGHAWFIQHSALILLCGALCAIVVFGIALAIVEGGSTVLEMSFGVAFLAAAFGVILAPNPIMAPPAMVTAVSVLIMAASGLLCLVRAVLPVPLEEG